MAVFSKYSTNKKSAPSGGVFGKYGGATKLASSSGVFGKYKPKTSSASSGLDIERLFAEANLPVPEENDKLSLLGRLTSVLSSLETGNAVFTGLDKKSVTAGVGSYVTGVGKGIASGITGRDFGQTDKKTYKDVLEKYGVDNGVAKFGLGFVGDVLLDPSTYVGGSLVKGAIKGGKFVGKGVLKGVGKVAPEVEKGLTIAGKGVKDALGRGFVPAYGTSKGLREKVLTVMNKKDDAKLGLVMSNIKRLGTGTLSESQQKELAIKMLAGKRAEFAGGAADDAIKAASSADPLVQKSITAQAARSQKLAKQMGLDDPFTVYYPSLRKENIQKFFNNTKALKVGSEGWKKEFKNLLGDDELVLNPAEAFAKREVEMVSDKIVRDELGSMVRSFGKKLTDFASKDDALKAGYKVVKEKGQFGKEIGYLKEVDKKFIDDMISPEFGTIDAIAKHTGFDAVTSLFKRSVTGLFPSFHVRNYVSGMLQNYEVLGAKALSPVNVGFGHKIALAMAKGKTTGNATVDIAGKAYSLNKVIKPFAKRFGTSSQYIADIADATAVKKLTKIKSLNPASADSRMFRKARAIGNFIETQQKGTAYITALRSGKTVKEALALAEKSGFDYRSLTGLESKVLRRIIPFYSFTRKNIELQLRTLGENPQRIGNILKLMRDAGNLTEEEKAGLPDYAQEQFTIKIGKDFAVGFGTPIEQINQMFGPNPIRRLAASMNPVFKLPLERAFGLDFFRDRPLNEVVEAGEYAKAPGFIQDFLQVREIEEIQKDGTKKTTYKANPYRLQLLRNLPTTRGATYVSAIFDDRSTPSKILSSFTGIKPKPIDLETVEYFRNRDRQRELEQLLIQAGVLKKFEKVYEPKNSKIKEKDGN